MTTTGVGVEDLAGVCNPWAWLLRHVFAIDLNVCPQCAGPMKWREVALTAESIRIGLARAGRVYVKHMGDDIWIGGDSVTCVDGRVVR